MAEEYRPSSRTSAPSTPKASEAAASGEGEWMYGGIVVPVLPDPPAPTLKAFRQNRATGAIEWKDAPERDANKLPLTAKQVFGLEPIPE